MIDRREKTRHGMWRVLFFLCAGVWSGAVQHDSGEGLVYGLGLVGVGGSGDCDDKGGGEVE